MIDPRRRLFLRGRVAQAAAPQAPAAAQRPPWALAEDAFTACCTRCHACVPACPRQVIAVGDGGFPVMDFARQGCDLCAGQPACAAACEPGALQGALPDGDGHAPWPGWHLHVSAHCLAQRRVECRACADVCEPRAIRFRPAPGGIAQMHIDTAACTGCGECVGVCPVGAAGMTKAVPS
ncbi:MAG: ferredoxin-type protein NapF [Pseudomonadota bacterium]|nr:ferredoxin-type protein NapF [Pseudomonadota bacterium]